MAIKRCIPVMEMACLRVACHKPTQVESQNGWAVRVRCLPAGDLFPQYTGSAHVLCVLFSVCPNYMQSDYFAIFMEY